ncbi:MAG: hypothetical protein R2851_25480 [Caldilineaceae bacterium]
MGAALAGLAVAAQAFATLQLVQGTVDAHEEDVERRQQSHQRAAPRLTLQHVLHDQRVAGRASAAMQR